MPQNLISSSFQSVIKSGTRSTNFEIEPQTRRWHFCSQTCEKIGSEFVIMLHGILQHSGLMVYMSCTRDTGLKDFHVYLMEILILVSITDTSGVTNNNVPSLKWDRLKQCEKIWTEGDVDDVVSLWLLAKSPWFIQSTGKRSDKSLPCYYLTQTIMFDV
jgi:hypothetical protein